MKVTARSELVGRIETIDEDQLRLMDARDRCEQELAQCKAQISAAYALGNQYRSLLSLLDASDIVERITAEIVD